MRFTDDFNAGHRALEDYEPDTVETHPTLGQLEVHATPAYADRPRWDISQLLPGDRGRTRKRWMGEVLHDQALGSWWATPKGVRRDQARQCATREEALAILDAEAPQWKPRKRK